MISVIAGMYIIQQFLIFYVVSTSGFSLQTVFSDCLFNCTNEVCKKNCKSDLIEYPPFTEANVTLHCVSKDTIIIKFNPGVYIVEQIEKTTNNTKKRRVNGSLAKFVGLTPGTEYQFLLYNYTEEGTWYPEASDWFSTFASEYKPLPVKNLTQVKFEADNENLEKLHAEVSFEPADDRSCNYDVLVKNGKKILVVDATEFQFKVTDLKFNEEIDVLISSLLSANDQSFRDWKEATFVTPTCLEYYQNVTICPPERVTCLQVQHTLKESSTNYYNLNISWNKSSYEPSYYAIILDLDGNHTYEGIVPGNQTTIDIANVYIERSYEVSIIASSPGGSSPLSSIVKTVTPGFTRPNKEEFYREIMIGSILSVAIVALGGMAYLQYRRQKNRNLAMECPRFEPPNDKSQLDEMMKKLLPQHYNSKNSNLLVQLHDKFELCPKFLELKGVLGSGAYGIVRLGQLRDKSDNIINVAVKMLKDHPSPDDMQNFYKEIMIMQIVGHHPNVVSLIGYCNLFNKPVLVVEYCCKGDLQTYLRTIWQNILTVVYNNRVRLEMDADLLATGGIKNFLNHFGEKKHDYANFQVIANRLYDIQEDISQYTQILTMNDLLNIARQIATGMQFLSSNRIVHRDLAARNILICSDGIVKISDFGLSRDMYQENLYRKKGKGKLPLKWMAIEALTHQIYTTHSDVWSFGILLWEIVTMGAIPYPGISNSLLLKLLKSGYRMEKPSNCSSELYDIMFSCWNVQPQSRPTFTQLKESLDKLLTYHSDNKYLNMDEMLCEAQEQYSNVP